MSFGSEGRACPDYEAKLEDFLSGELPGAEKREVSDHIKACVSCKRALDEAQMSSRLLQLMDMSPDPGPAFSRVVMARIRSEEVARQSRGFWQPFVSLAWRFAATAALALVAMVTYDVTSHQVTSEPTAPVAQAQLRDMFTTDATSTPASRDEFLLVSAESENGKR